MNTRATIGADGETITIHVPMTFRKRGGRKQVVTPDGAEWAPRPQIDNAMVKALARAFRWRKMLDEGDVATIRDLAQREKVTLSYAARVLQLTFLAPDLVEAILAGRQPAELQLNRLLNGFPAEWAGQPGAITASAPTGKARGDLGVAQAPDNFRPVS